MQVARHPTFPIRYELFHTGKPKELTREDIVRALYELPNGRRRRPSVSSILQTIFVRLVAWPGWLQSLLNLLPYMTKSCAQDMLNTFVEQWVDDAGIDYRIIRVSPKVCLHWRMDAIDADKVAALVRCGLNPWRLGAPERVPFIEPFLSFEPSRLPYTLLRGLRTLWLCCRRHGWNLDRGLRIRLARTAAMQELMRLKDKMYKKHELVKRRKLDMGDMGDTASGRLESNDPKARLHDALLRGDHDTVLRVLDPDYEWTPCTPENTMARQVVLAGKYEAAEAMCPGTISVDDYTRSISDLPEYERDIVRGFLYRLLSDHERARNTSRGTEALFGMSTLADGGAANVAAALQQGVPCWFCRQYRAYANDLAPRFIQRWLRAWLEWTPMAHQDPNMYTTEFRREVRALMLGTGHARWPLTIGYRIAGWLAVLHHFCHDRQKAPPILPMHSIARNKAWLAEARVDLPPESVAWRAADWEAARNQHALTVKLMAHSRVNK